MFVSWPSRKSWKLLVLLCLKVIAACAGFWFRIFKQSSRQACP